MLAAQSNFFAANTDGLCIVSISDSNNEKISGAAVELVGINKVYYTNINGICFIPKAMLSKAQMITINSISYKTAHLNAEDLNSKIILKSR